MDLLKIDHFTLSVAPEALTGLRDFYRDLLGLVEGPRPDFNFPGHWLYAGGAAVVHLAGNRPNDAGGPGGDRPTGRFDHVSFQARGLARTRRHLEARGIDWQEAPVPGFPLHQIFLRDPIGLKIELTFDAAELAEAGPSTRPRAY